MPCYDPQEADERRKVPAALCAILRVLEDRGALPEALLDADWGEAGVTAEWLRLWWADHKAEDAIRGKLIRKPR